MSAHEVNRVLRKFQSYIENRILDKRKKRIEELSNKKYFKLTKEEISKRVESEMDRIRSQVFHDFDMDVTIYKGLDNICKIARAQDFITIDNFEADFILTYSEIK